MPAKYKASYRLHARQDCTGLAVPMVQVIRTLRGNGLKEAKEEMDSLDGGNPDNPGRIRSATHFGFDVMLDDAALGRLTALCMERKDKDGWYMVLESLERLNAASKPLLIHHD